MKMKIAYTQCQLPVNIGQRSSSCTESSESEFPDIQAIRNVIPPHCFKPSTWRSLGYVVRDIALAGSLGWCAISVIPTVQASVWQYILWAVYGYCQGLVCTGIWILAHEAGHGAFSVHPWLNDLIGWTLHSLMLVPYFSWKFTHHRHHRFAGHMDRDMAFVPHRRICRPSLPTKLQSTMFWVTDMFEEVPVVQLVRLFGHQLVGWQLYLLFNITAGEDSLQREGAKWYRQSHFDPTSPLFRRKEAGPVVLSNLGIILVICALYAMTTSLGLKTIFQLYFVPYFWVHHWLVAITYLHHTHPQVHHYDAEGWSFVKGALATVDRDFGFVGRHLFHNIIDTHVVHHLFPHIPFYRAQEATEAMKPLLGNLYHHDDRPFLLQLWSTFTTCRFVEKDSRTQGRWIWNQ